MILSEKEYERLATWVNNNQTLSLEIEKKVDKVLSKRLSEYEKLLKESVK